MNLNKRWINIIAGLVGFAVGGHGIYSSFGGNFSGQHIDNLKLVFGIILIIFAIYALNRARRQTT